MNMRLRVSRTSRREIARPPGLSVARAESTSAGTEWAYAWEGSAEELIALIISLGQCVIDLNPDGTGELEVYDEYRE